MMTSETRAVRFAKDLIELMNARLNSRLGHRSWWVSGSAWYAVNCQFKAIEDQSKRRRYHPNLPKEEIPMNEIDKIQAQLNALLEARNYLLSQTPTDMAGLSIVTEKIIALNRRQAALSGEASIQFLSPVEVHKLHSAVAALNAQIHQARAASDILVAATAIADLA